MCGANVESQKKAAGTACAPGAPRRTAARTRAGFGHVRDEGSIIHDVRACPAQTIRPTVSCFLSCCLFRSLSGAHCCLRLGGAAAPSFPFPAYPLCAMDSRGQRTIDAQIECLLNREKLPEAEIRALCDKVRARRAAAARAARRLALPLLLSLRADRALYSRILARSLPALFRRPRRFWRPRAM